MSTQRPFNIWQGGACIPFLLVLLFSCNSIISAKAEDGESAAAGSDARDTSKLFAQVSQSQAMEAASEANINHSDSSTTSSANTDFDVNTKVQVYVTNEDADYGWRAGDYSRQEDLRGGFLYLGRFNRSDVFLPLPDNSSESMLQQTFQQTLTAFLGTKTLQTRVDSGNVHVDLDVDVSGSVQRPAAFVWVYLCDNLALDKCGWLRMRADPSTHYSSLSRSVLEKFGIRIQKNVVHYVKDANGKNKALNTAKVSMEVFGRTTEHLHEISVSEEAGAIPRLGFLSMLQLNVRIHTAQPMSVKEFRGARTAQRW